MNRVVLGVPNALLRRADSAVTVQDLPCNAFSWCGDTGGCFEPDIHRHEYRDCWLKFTEAPLAPEVPPPAPQLWRQCAKCEEQF